MTYEEAFMEYEAFLEHPGTYSIHTEHQWFHGFSVQSPPVDVYDCGCGARKRVLRGAVPEKTAESDSVNPGGSVNNCLNVLPDLLVNLPYPLTQRSM